MAGTSGSLGPGVVPVPLVENFRAALPLVGIYSENVFGKRLEIRVDDGIRTRDIQIHKQSRTTKGKPVNPLWCKDFTRSLAICKATHTVAKNRGELRYFHSQAGKNPVVNRYGFDLRFPGFRAYETERNPVED